jgi:glutamate-1-semialdehyde 2,1-aminomutase
MGSMVVPSTDEFVNEIAAFASRHDIPLIFDEVIAFRHAYGGAHVTYDVEPDLVTLGKAIGGGFPVGAFGGREELMAGYDPRGGAKIVHSGTFNANPVTAAAGLAALEEYTVEEVGRLNRLGERVAEGCCDIVRDRGVAVEVNQVGSLFNLYPTTDPVENYRDAAQSVTKIERQLFFELLDRGVRVVPKLMGSLSTPMDESDVTAFVEALDDALGSMRPLFERHGLIQ